LETKLQQEINKVLSNFSQYWNGETLLKSKVIDDLRIYKTELMEALLANDAVKHTYSIEIANGSIFKVDEFISMLRYKNYWENSYTKFSNEIGLNSDNRYLKYNTDVVVDFPHKDCVLEGGMSSEDIGKKEVYYHKVLAKEEIDTLFSPKVLNKIKRIDQTGQNSTEMISEKDNLVLKGNNLIALNSLKHRFAGKVKLIYIDPPYNTGGDSFIYNDRFNHSTWLTFMQNRLISMRELLADDGSIWINIDDNEGHYLKVLCDEIFGRQNFISSIIWRSSDNSNNDAKRFSQDHNYILVYSKNENWYPKKVKLSEEQSKHYKNPDNDPRGPWFDGNPISSPNPRPNLRFDIIAPNGNVIKPPANGWRWSESTLKEKIKTGEIRFNSANTNIKRRTYLNEQAGVPSSTLWTDLQETGHNRQAKYEQKKLFPEKTKEEWFSTPKPEKLIKKILEVATDEGDIVLDAFLGSGTTAAVSLKMKRRFIGIEQMNITAKNIEERLTKVVNGDINGISNEVEWSGGSSFIFAELFELNQIYVSNIQQSKNVNELELLIRNMKETAFFDYKVKLDRLTNEDSGFVTMSFEEKKQLLIESLDANQMYLSYSEMDDEQYKISEQVKQFNRSFYQGQKSGGGES
jgi:adenine-specific DNA-methyltransferase